MPNFLTENGGTKSWGESKEEDNLMLLTRQLTS
mgnify:FL=1